jgi:hypothetical protein
MKANDSEVLRIDPGVVAVLMARARRARAEAVHNVFVHLIMSPPVHAPAPGRGPRSQPVDASASFA